ncbi:MAG: hypothetical protein R2857_01580 [Vampirovibrionales bacterium]
MKTSGNEKTGCILNKPRNRVEDEQEDTTPQSTQPQTTVTLSSDTIEGYHTAGPRSPRSREPIIEPRPPGL